MIRITSCLLALLLLPAGQKLSQPAPDGPTYTPDGQLKMPANYREWIFLGSGIDMSYATDVTDPNMHMVNSVFVNPSAYRSFQQTGHWPEGATLVLENRGAQRAASINKRGLTETSEIMGLEVHVLDSAHIPGGWGFYGFDNPKSAKLIPRPATCYTCHEQHAAVDTTFVQFYPTLQAAAESHKTWSQSYLAETAKPAPAK